MRYFLQIAYKGTRYRGWQRQPKVRSVQAVLEEKLSALLHQKCIIHPCGRTDAGVHASQFFAHIDIEKDLDFDLIFRINKLLPNDITVDKLWDVPASAHAQLDAMNRTYRYYIHRQKNPFLEEGSTWYDKALDVDLMKQALPLIRDNRDFRSMCLTPDAHAHTFCQIHALELYQQPNGNRLCLEIAADRFLRGMVRLLVARLLDIGSRKLSLAAFQHALESGERVPFHTSAKPQGLYLAKVEYPFLDVAQSPVFEE